MTYKIADKIKFHRPLLKDSEAVGTILEVQKMGELPTVVYTVKLDDSASIVHLIDDEIIGLVKGGLHHNIECLMTI